MKMQVYPKNGAKKRTAFSRAPCVCLKTAWRGRRRTLRQTFSGIARKATGMIVHVVHLRMIFLQWTVRIPRTHVYNTLFCPLCQPETDRLCANFI